MPLSEIKKTLEEARKHFVFSGAQVYAEKLSGDKTVSKVQIELGETSYWRGAMRVSSDTFFDIGSITKVLATTSILARLEAYHGQFGKGLEGTPYAKITISDILTHTAGFIPWYPLYKELENTTPLDWFLANSGKVLGKPGKVVYSDLGFIFLWEILKPIIGPIDPAFQKEVAKPLSLMVRYGPMKPVNVAATEYDTLRKNVLVGEVFDENARALGGKAPHAGLFGSALSIAPWCREWLRALDGHSNWISKETAQRFTARSAMAKDTPRALGFDLKSPVGSSCGTLMTEKTFGHLGYTGCSVWMDPERSLLVVFLTNRVHPSRVDERIRLLRPVVHDKVVETLEGK